MTQVRKLQTPISTGQIPHWSCLTWIAGFVILDPIKTTLYKAALHSVKGGFVLNQGLSAGVVLQFLILSLWTMPLIADHRASRGFVVRPSERPVLCLLGW